MEQIGKASTRKRDLIWRIALFLVTLYCSKGFVISPDKYIGKSAVPADTTDYLWAFFTLALWQLMVYAYVRRRMRPRIGEVVFGLLFGTTNFLGTALFAYDSWLFIGTTMPLYNAVGKCLGQGVAMMTALTVFSNLLSSAPASESDLRMKYFPRLRTMYRRYTALVCSLLFFLSWLPYMVAFYPGTVIYDMCVMVRQFFRLEPMATWHSVYTTCIFGSCIWLGRLLGSDNAGTLIYMLLQSVALAAALGQSIRCLRALKVGRGWQAAVFVFYALAPIWGYYCMMIGKDTLYTAMMMLFLLKTIELSRRKTEVPLRTAEMVFYGFVALSACLIRNNGLYVVVPSALVMLFMLFRGKRRRKIAIPLLSAAMAAILFTFVAIPALGVVNNNFAGFHYVLFQQTARTLRDHADEVTEEEKAVIDKVLDVDQIANAYEPWIADPVRNTYQLEDADQATQQAALSEYRAVWLQMLAKYPMTYLRAFIANNSGYYAFTPFISGITYLQQAGLRFVFQNYWEPESGELHTTQPDGLETPRSFFISLATRWRTLPVLSLLYVLPVYTWLLIAAGISMAHQRRWRELALFIPALLSFGVCIVSPVNDYLRYFLPIIAMTPVLLALAKAKREDTEGEIATPIPG